LQLTFWRYRVQVLAYFVNLSAQVAPLVRRHAADPAIHFRIAASFLHGAALFLGTFFVATRIELAGIAGARLRRFAAPSALLMLGRIAALAVLRLGLCMHQSNTQQTATEQRCGHRGSNAKRCACCCGYFFVIDEHGVPWKS
jgi:hypothetical protein